MRDWGLARHEEPQASPAPSCRATALRWRAIDIYRQWSRVTDKPRRTDTFQPRLCSLIEVLVTGGSITTPVASAELYDPVSGPFTPTGGMAVARENHTTTLLSGLHGAASQYPSTMSPRELIPPLLTMKKSIYVQELPWSDARNQVKREQKNMPTLSLCSRN